MNAADQKASGEGEQDLSMEEILQSIRKIIAEEGEGVPPEQQTTIEGGNSEVPGSDVLELTQMLEEEEESPPARVEAEPGGEDILDKIDASLNPTPEPQSAPAQAAAPKEPPAPAQAKPVAPKEEPKPEIPLVDETESEAEAEDSLLSQPTASASAQAMKKVAQARPTPPPIPSPELRSGATVEDLVIETLKPMLKDWLDQNLPTVVERIVEREIKKLASD